MHLVKLYHRNKIIASNLKDKYKNLILNDMVLLKREFMMMELKIIPITKL